MASIVDFYESLIYTSSLFLEPRYNSSRTANLTKMKISHSKLLKERASASSAQIRELSANGKKTRESALSCPLATLELPPVNEMEHTTKRCFCYLCTCKTHICPGANRPPHLISSSQYLSSYNKFYQKYKTEPFNRIAGPVGYELKGKLSSYATTNKEHYKPHQVKPIQLYKKLSVPVMNCRFAGESSYKQDYAN